jgi:UDP-2,4-diacetamido-2,4,6-trideoxy-beta-L-altropyranose hydrolase
MGSKKWPETVFVVNTGPQIGWGHYIRSRAIASDFVSAGANVRFYVKGMTPRLSAEKYPVSVLNQDITYFLQHLVGEVQVVVLDLNEVSSEILKSLEAFPVSVCIDDGSALRFNCDLLVNPNVNGEFKHRFASRTKYMSGSKYILLRPQFDHVPERRCKRSPVHLFVAFGGTDPACLTPWVIGILKGTDQLSLERITVLMGDDESEAAIRALTHGDKRFRVLRGADDVCSLLIDADMGIISAGTVLYEAAVTGLPVLVVSLNESQAREARVFHDEGVAVYLGDAGTLNGKVLMRELKRLEAQAARQHMAKQGQSLVDGQGRERVAKAILGLAMEESEGCMIPAPERMEVNSPR